MICVLKKGIYVYRDKCYNIQHYSVDVENMVLECVELVYQLCCIEGCITVSDNIGRQIAKIINILHEYKLL